MLRLLNEVEGSLLNRGVLKLNIFLILKQLKRNLNVIQLAEYKSYVFN